jgi:hypothetical protein
MGSVQRAETLGKGNFEFGVEPGTWIGIVTNQALGDSNVYLPAFNLSARFGLSDRVDLGVKTGTTGLEGNAKFMLTDPANNFVISLAPSIGGAGIAASSGGTSAAVGFVNIAVPVLIGLKFGEHELTFGPRLNNFLVFAGAGTSSGVVYSFLPGVSVGFAARITDFFELMPEVAFGFPVAGAGTATSGGQSGSVAAITAGNSAILTFTVGVKFGRLKKHGANAEPPAETSPPPPPPVPAPDQSLPPPPPPPPPAPGT